MSKALEEIKEAEPDIQHVQSTCHEGSAPNANRAKTFKDETRSEVTRDGRLGVTTSTQDTSPEPLQNTKETPLEDSVPDSDNPSASQASCGIAQNKPKKKPKSKGAKHQQIPLDKTRECNL